MRHRLVDLNKTILKLSILAFFLVIGCQSAFALNKYVSPAGGNFATSGTWVTTSGGSTVTPTPTASDVCYATNLSGNLTFDGANACSQFIATGYTGVLNSTSSANVFTVTTNITISATTTFGATAFRIKSGAGNATWNIGVTFPWDFEIGANGTKTLSQDITIGGITYISTNPTAINGNKWFAVGGIEATIAANKIFYGSTELWVQGGRYYYITKRTGGKLVFDGNVELRSELNTSTMGIYDSTLAYNSGTITVYADSVFNINGTSTIDASVGNNIVFENLDFSGTLTLNSDLYAAHSIASIGTSSLAVSGAYTIHVGYGGGTGHVIMYNAGTFISTTTKISVEGTGTIFRATSYNGMAYAPVSALQIDVDINSVGTVTFETYNGTINRFGGGRTLTYVAGTVVVTGCTFYVTTGNYTFNVNNNFTVPTFTNTTIATFPTAFTATTMNLETGSTTNATGNLTVDTLRMNGSAVLTKPNDATIVNVTTNFYQNGTDALAPTIVASPISVTEFMGGTATTMSSDISSANATRRIGITQFPDQHTFSFAFDIKYNGYTGYKLLGQGDGYLWFPASPYMTRFYFYLNPSDAYYCTHGMHTVGVVNNRVVITKSLGNAMKFYVNGAQKTTSVQGAAATLLNEDFNFTTFAGQLTGDVLFFQTEVDTTWVAADFAKFQANGNSSAGQYDNTEPNLVAGWHVDSFDSSVTNMNFKYDGTLANSQLFQSAFNYVDASTSAVPILTYNGSESSSINVYPLTGENFKPYAVATA